ncbi:hypothetical protein [Brevibacillus dissolubilis]|uniref:hypothetical protein n=1 Tax=Brevibacillus dissolubilis TaxID=1844116 RepID=UPI00159BDBA2|nr:hypothetical protein [Brevibacillus dissolubilis]
MKKVIKSAVITFTVFAALFSLTGHPVQVEAAGEDTTATATDPVGPGAPDWGW